MADMAISMSPDWLSLYSEKPVDPDRPIVDPHHHLWPPGLPLTYGVDELLPTLALVTRREDRLRRVRRRLRARDPDPMEPVGETRFVASAAADLLEGIPSAPIAGIVATTDVRSGALDDVLDAHIEAGRRTLPRHPPRPRFPIAPEESSRSPVAHPPGSPTTQRSRPACVDSASAFTYDSWHYHHQNQEFLAVARHAPTTMVLDHFGTPLGVGRFAGRHDEIFPAWCDDMRDRSVRERRCETRRACDAGQWLRLPWRPAAVKRPDPR